HLDLVPGSAERRERLARGKAGPLRHQYANGRLATQGHRYNSRTPSDTVNAIIALGAGATLRHRKGLGRPPWCHSDPSPPPPPTMYRAALAPPRDAGSGATDLWMGPKRASLGKGEKVVKNKDFYFVALLFRVESQNFP